MAHLQQRSPAPHPITEATAAVADWLVARGLDDVDPATLLDELCQRLHDAGLPLIRANLGFDILHPTIAFTSHTWWRDHGLETTHGMHASLDSGAWLDSPYYRLVQSGALTMRIAIAHEAVPFPIVDELRAAGATDYLACRVPFDGKEERGIIASFATDRPGGFADADIRALEHLRPLLGLACKAAIKEQVARNVLSAYLGPEAGVRVLHGQIRHGAYEAIHTVIWYSDMRSSTSLADSMPPSDFLAMLDAYFECTAGAVLAEGGEVLLLIGDAVLAIFPIDRPIDRPINEAGEHGARTEEQACAAALRAAHAAEQRLHEVNAARTRNGQPLLDFGLALHVGDLMYGNIGVPERLQLTVVGPTANEVARLEALTKRLGRRVLVSSRFAGNLALPWEALGTHELRGVGAPQEIFGLFRR